MTGYVRDLRAWMGPWRRFRRSLAKRRSLPPALARIDAVDGQISRAEAELLYELAAGVTTGVIVEVGTFHGKSTVALALGAQAGARPRVFGVDPFVTFTGEYGRTFTPAEKIPLLQNLLLAGVAEHVWLLQTTSQQAAAGWTEPIGFLWIDGDHSYDGARGDFTAWAAHLVPGGHVAFHDSRGERSGATRLVREVVAARDGWEEVRVVERTTVLRKVARAARALGAPAGA
jgi:predicted O-methyltransferase YrrM